MRDADRMSDIFISYGKEDRSWAETLAQALETQGWSVWWDRHIPAGKTFDEVIEKAIDAAKCIVVLWSKSSVASRWVRAEAQIGLDCGNLVPILIEPETKIPLLFRPVQAADLTGWDGADTASSFESLVADIAVLLGTHPRAEEEKRQAEEAESKRKTEKEAKRKAEEEKKRQAEEEESKRKAEIEAKRRAEEEKKRQAEEEESKRKAEIEAKRKAEGAKKRQAEVTMASPPQGKTLTKVKRRIEKGTLAGAVDDTPTKVRSPKLPSEEKRRWRSSLRVTVLAIAGVVILVLVASYFRFRPPAEDAGDVEDAGRKPPMEEITEGGQEETEGNATALSEADRLFEEANLTLNSPGGTTTSQLEQAAKDFGQVLVMVPDYPRVAEGQALCYALLAEKFASTGDIDRAYRTVSKALSAHRTMAAESLQERLRSQLEEGLRESVSLDSPSNGDYLNSREVIVRGRLKGDVVREVFVNGETASVGSNGSFECSVILGMDGKHNVQVKALDGNGVGIELPPVSVTVDPTPPVIEIEEPRDGEVLGVGEVSVRGKIRESHLSTLVVNGMPVKIQGERWSVALKLGPGKQMLIVTAKDRADNRTTLEKQITVGSNWERAIESISNRSACPMYKGLKILKQEGLVPVGRDRESGLWEFAHPHTGEIPDRNEDGNLILTEKTGLVFVLIPGGEFWMGSQANKDEPNYDPAAKVVEGPVHKIALDPFLLSKYEMTQGQWIRRARKNPSTHRTSLIHPVESVSWTDCCNVLLKCELELPTEAQWEYAARAGTNSVWWTGNEADTLHGAAKGPRQNNFTFSRERLSSSRKDGCGIASKRSDAFFCLRP